MTSACYFFRFCGGLGHGLSGVTKRSSVRSAGYQASEISMRLPTRSYESRRQNSSGMPDGRLLGETCCPRCGQEADGDRVLVVTAVTLVKQGQLCGQRRLATGSRTAKGGCVVEVY